MKRWPGAPIPVPHPTHRPIVPTAAGIPPACTCGWTQQPIPNLGETLIDHLAQHDPTYRSNR